VSVGRILFWVRSRSQASSYENRNNTLDDLGYIKKKEGTNTEIVKGTVVIVGHLFFLLFASPTTISNQRQTRYVTTAHHFFAYDGGGGAMYLRPSLSS